MEGNNNGLLNELKGYSKEDLSKLAKAIDANKNETLKVSSTTQTETKFRRQCCLGAGKVLF